MRTFSLIAGLFVIAGPAWAVAPASDDASDPVYSDGWDDGDDGGSGWGSGWGFSESNDPMGLAGYFVGTSTLNGDGDDDEDGDIDTQGLAFGFSVRDIISTNAIRSFDGSFVVGDRISFDLDHEPALTGSSFITFGLLGAGLNVFEIRIGSSSSDYVYRTFNPGGTSFDSGVTASDEGTHFEFELTAVDQFALRITPLGGETSEFTGSLGSSVITIMRFNMQASGSATEQFAYFNSVIVPEPSSAWLNATVLVVTAGLSRVRARPRRTPAA